MYWLWFLLLLIPVITSFVFAGINRNTFMWDDGYVILNALIILGAIVASCVLVFVPFSRDVDRRACTRYGHVNQRVVKFVTYNWGSWDCLTKDNHGNWIPKDNLISIK